MQMNYNTITTTAQGIRATAQQYRYRKFKIDSMRLPVWAK